MTMKQVMKICMYTKKLDAYYFFCNIDFCTTQYLFIIKNLDQENNGVMAELEYGDALVLPGNVFHSGVAYINDIQTDEEKKCLF